MILERTCKVSLYFLLKINSIKNCTMYKVFSISIFLSRGEIYNTRVLIQKFPIYKIRGTIYMIKLIIHQHHPN